MSYRLRLKFMGALALSLGAACSQDKPRPVETAEPTETAEPAESATGGPWYPDADGDGYGSSAEGEEVVSEEAPPGYVASNEDCDDGDAGVYPGASERCNERDDDCDGQVDEDAVDATAWYADADGDGFGDPASLEYTCDVSAGYVEAEGDCDDSDAVIHPGVDERCDGLDNDCDGQVDEEAVDASTWYGDLDGDGYGDATSPIDACEIPVGAAEISTDCDDDNLSIHPGADEICNGIDEDCDGTVDEDDDGDDAVDSLCDLWSDHVLSDADVKVVGDYGDGLGWRQTIIASDVNADGYSDYWLGARTSFLGGTWSGAVYLLQGPVLESGYAPDLATATLVGAVERGKAGLMLEDAGDVAGDGYPGVWVAVPYDSTTMGAGSVRLVLGPVSGTLSMTSADSAWVTDDSGTNLTSIDLGTGDYDGDDVPDLIIGASKDDSGAGWLSGAVWVTRLDGVWGEHGLSAAPVMFYSAHEEEGLGLRTAIIGSTNGDGIDDLLITGWGIESVDTAGLIWVVEETPGDGTYLIDDIADAHLVGEAAEDGSAYEAVELGDMNGDGYTDYAIGGQGESTAAYSAGAVYVLYGPTGDRSSLAEADVKFLGVEQQSGVCIVAGEGDVDGDGALDIAIGGYQGGDGSPENSLAGTAFLVRGPLEEGTNSLADADALFNGEYEDYWAGAGLSIDGDTNKDGYPEIGIGSPGYNEAGVDIGAVYFYFGQPY